MTQHARIFRVIIGPVLSSANDSGRKSILIENLYRKDGDGYTNTFFTRNASEIAKRIQTFDEELEYLLDQKGWTPENSREKAIEELKSILTSLKD